MQHCAQEGPPGAEIGWLRVINLIGKGMLAAELLKTPIQIQCDLLATVENFGVNVTSPNAQSPFSLTVLANLRTARSAEVRPLSLMSARSNIWMSWRFSRRARSAAGHMSSQVPTMEPLPALRPPPPCSSDVCQSDWD